MHNCQFWIFFDIFTTPALHRAMFNTTPHPNQAKIMKNFLSKSVADPAAGQGVEAVADPEGTPTAGMAPTYYLA